jgi:hypothetical protein
MWHFYFRSQAIDFSAFYVPVRECLSLLEQIVQRRIFPVRFDLLDGPVSGFC